MSTVDPSLFVLSVGWDKRVACWNVAEEKQHHRTPKVHTGILRAVAVSTDASLSLICSAGDDAHLVVWRVLPGREFSNTPLHDISLPARTNEISFFPASSKIAVTCAASVLIYDAESGEQVGSFSDCDSQRAFSCVAVSPDGRAIATCAANQIQIWDASTLELLTAFSDDQSVTSLCWFGDSKLITGNLEGYLRVWAPALGRKLLQLRGPDGAAAAHERSVSAVAVSPSGAIIASCSHNKQLLLWDAETGRWVARLFAPTDYLYSLSFSSDSRFLSVGTGASTKGVVIYDVWTSETVTTFIGNDGPVNCVCAFQLNA